MHTTSDAPREQHEGPLSDLLSGRKTSILRAHERYLEIRIAEEDLLELAKSNPSAAKLLAEVAPTNDGDWGGPEFPRRALDHATITAVIEAITVAR